MINSDIVDGGIPAFLVTFRQFGLPRHCVEFAMSSKKALEHAADKNQEGEDFKVREEIKDQRRLKVCLHLASLS